MTTGRARRKLNVCSSFQIIAAGLMVVAVSFARGQVTALQQTQSVTPQAPTVQSPMPDWQIAAGGKLEFDVVSVREDKNPDDPSSVNVPYGSEDAYTNTGGVFSAKNWPLVHLIAFAFKNSTSQRDAFRASLPDWALSQGFNIEARTDNHDVSKDQMRLMVQSLLVERFKLKVHYETRQVSVYAVELVKPGILGPGLRRHPADDLCSAIAPRPAQTDGDGPPPTPLTVPGGFPTRCGSFVNMPPTMPYLRHEGARNITMAQIVSTFTGMGNLGRPVVDRTGLTGTYDWVMEFIDERPGHNPPPDADGVTFQEALKNQVGLKLVPEKAPFELFIVDHVERPTDN
jgi:uncharacterized protein (TIGR03435 family)